MKHVDTFDKTIPKTLPLLFKSVADNYPLLNAQAAKNKDGKFIYYTYSSVYDDILAFSNSLETIGIKRGDNVGLISDNRREWLISDLSILSLGATDVPRGCDSTEKEINYILSHSDCEICIFENYKQLQKIFDSEGEKANIKKAILFEKPDTKNIDENATDLQIFFFEDLLTLGHNLIEENGALRKHIENEMLKTDDSDVATIIYTSGTTGVPKGVMLTHRNFIAQMEVMHDLVPVGNGDVWFTVLPVWHSFERAIQYGAITMRCCLAYSKPIGSIMLPDMATVKPHIMCGVPRLWESISQGVYKTMRKQGKVKFSLFKFFIEVGKKYVWAKDHVTGLVCRFYRRVKFFDFLIGLIPLIFLAPFYALGEKIVYKKIRQKLGGNFMVGISGGGALQPNVDEFYRVIKLPLLEGYGMTETSPIISVRDYRTPRAGCVGRILLSVQIKIVAEKYGDILSYDPLPPGKQGMILAKGDQIMKGYYKRDDMTSRIINKDGWLNTGDIGMMTYDNEIKITGRAKDTIVLLDGENIEPVAIECAMSASQYIESAIVFGQDKKYLVSLIVPNKDLILEYAKENELEEEDYVQLLKFEKIQSLIRKEIDSNVNIKNGFKKIENIYRFHLLPESFRVGEELSAKQEYMRSKINAKYSKVIEQLFS